MQPMNHLKSSPRISGGYPSKMDKCTHLVPYLNPPQDSLIPPSTMSSISQAELARCNMGNWDSMTTHTARRFTKAAERSQQLIRNRIKYLALQEEKHFRALQDVERRSAAIAAGRRQAHMRKLRDQQVMARRERCMQSNVEFVRQAMRQDDERHARIAAARTSRLMENRELKKMQRSESEHVIRQRSLSREAEKKDKQERAAAIQQEKVQAFLKQCREKAESLAKIHDKKQQAWREAVHEAQEAGAAVQDMEQQEMLSISSLQNSRQATQAALCDLESRVDAASPSPRVFETALDLHSMSGNSPLKRTNMNRIPGRLPLRIGSPSFATTISGSSQLSSSSSLPSTPATPGLGRPFASPRE